MGIGEKMKRLEEAAKEMASAIISAESIRVVSHYDADGISSAAIMTKALVRENRKFHLSIVKQVDEGVLQAEADSVDEMVLFLDLGTG